MSRKDDNPIGFVMFISLLFIGVLVFILAVGSCNPTPTTPSGPASAGCEWEKEKPKPKVRNYFGKGTGGSSGGRGGGFKAPAPKPASPPKAPSMTKPGTKNGGTYTPAKPRYTKVNPPPRPTAPAGKGYVWVLDCD